MRRLLIPVLCALLAIAAVVGWSLHKSARQQERLKGERAKSALSLIHI